MSENSAQSVSRYSAADAVRAAALMNEFPTTPRMLGGLASCMCRDSVKVPSGRCRACGAFVLADWEWDLMTGNVNGYQERESDWAEYCHGDGQDDYGNRCVGYADSEYPCTKCCAQQAVHNPAGLVKTETPTTKNGKEHITEESEVVLMAYVQGMDKAIVIEGVAETSIRFEKGTDDIRTLVFEFISRDMHIGYVPDVMYFVTR